MILPNIVIGQFDRVLAAHCAALVQSGKGSDQAARERHEKRRPYPLVTNVGDDQAHLGLAFDVEGIVEIACHLARGTEASSDLPTRGLRELTG